MIDWTLKDVLLPARCTIAMVMWNSNNPDDYMLCLEHFEKHRGKIDVFYEEDGFAVYHYKDGVLDDLYLVFEDTPIEVYLYEDMKDLLDEQGCETEEQLKQMWSDKKTN